MKTKTSQHTPKYCADCCYSSDNPLGDTVELCRLHAQAPALLEQRDDLLYALKCAEALIEEDTAMSKEEVLNTVEWAISKAEDK